MRRCPHCTVSEGEYHKMSCYHPHRDENGVYRRPELIAEEWRDCGPTAIQAARGARPERASGTIDTDRLATRR